MSYLQINNRPKKKRILFTILFLAVISIAILNMLGVNFLPSFLYASGGPLWRIEGFWNDKVGGIVHYFDSKEKLARENELLNERISVMRQNILLAEEVGRQNAEMKELLGRPEKENIIFATVLAGPPKSPYDVLILDVGAKHGLSIGDKVITSGRGIVGELSQVYENYSRADLYSSPGKELLMFIGEERFSVTGIGVGGGVFEIILPKEDNVEVGAAVYLADREPILVGTVENVFDREVDFLKLVTVSSVANIYELRYVGVIASSSKIVF